MDKIEAVKHLIEQGERRDAGRWRRDAEKQSNRRGTG